MEKFSHSKLSTFEQCRYKYKLQYIEKVKLPYEFQTIEAFLGSMVHDSLEFLYRTIEHGAINKEHLIEYFLLKWKAGYKDITIVKDLKEDDYKNKGIKFLFDYYDRFFPFDDETVLLECNEYLQLKNGENYSIRIDRLAKVKNDYYIHDYKTSNWLKTKDDIEKDRQLDMYALWVKLNFKAERVFVVWHFLNFDKDVICEKKIENLEFAKEQVESLIVDINDCKIFYVNNSILCNWCEFKKICHSFANVDEVKDLLDEKEFKKLEF
tara:strand:+ start:362 stop:1159 length:798 start_codon:yes stop_codon:yes gene_type:complete